MTAAKKWPENAEWARVDSIAILEKASCEILEAIDRDDLTPAQRIKLLAKANNKVKIAQQYLREARSN